MRKGPSCPKVRENVKVKEALLAITRARSGSTCVVNERGILAGIFTDGDLRRHLETDPHLLERPVKAVMTKTPTVISKDHLASEALRVLREKRIDEIPVVDGHKKLIGLLDVQDLLKAGIV